jgi:hypothetical protein
MSFNQWLEAVGRASVWTLIARSIRRSGKKTATPTARPNTLFCPESLEPRRLLSVAPTVLSINRATPATAITGSSTVSYTVTFSEAVFGVAASDFSVVTSGTVAASPNLSLTANSDSMYTVEVFGITGNGTLGLNLKPGTSIHDSSNTPLTSNNAQNSFQAQQTYAVAAYPHSVVIADVNGDGIPDLVTANGSGSISVLVGNGNGTFQPQHTFFAGAAPYGLAVADLNGDGKLDLVVANSGGDNVAVLLGNGDGTFAAPQTFAVGTAPQSVAIADVNGDGKPDLVVANYAVHTISVLLGNGNGTFQPQQTFAAGNAPNSVAVADVNGDSKPDLITTNIAERDVSVLLGNGNGTFLPQHTFAAGRIPKSVAVADLNGDGKPDLIVANDYHGMVNVLMGNGNGTFQAPRTFGTGYGADFVAAADVTGDGKPDLVVANSYDNSVSVLPGIGDGTFQSQRSFAVGSGPAGIAIADLNSDGQPDIVVANEGSNSVSVLLANGQSGFTGQTFTIAAPAPLGVALGGSIPATVIAGQKIKASPTITFTAIGTSFKGSISEALYLSPASGVFDPTAIALPQSLTRSVNLKSGAHQTIHVKLASIPASIPNGTYKLVVNITEPGGVTAFAAASQTITVAPPEIVLAGSVAKIPATAKAGKPLPVTISVSDTGNIAAVGSLPMIVYASPDGMLADAQQLSSQSHRISIKPGKTLRFALAKLVAPTTAGRYFILIRLDPAATFPAVTDPDTLLVSATAVAVS